MIFKVGLHHLTAAECHKVNKNIDQVVSVSVYVCKSVTEML